jgi:hypothetical protein
MSETLLSNLIPALLLYVDLGNHDVKLREVSGHVGIT